MSKMRLIGWCIALLVCGWMGMRTYHYFFNTTMPEIHFSGIVDGRSYAGDVSCVVSGEHPYKVKTVTVLLDEKPLTYNFGIGKSSFEYPFPLQTKTLLNGKHELEIQLVDGTMRKNRASKKITFFVDNVPLQAAFVKQNEDLRVFQGKTLHLQLQANKPLKEAFVRFLSKRYPCFPESEDSLIYEAFIPIDCDENPSEYLLSIDCYDAVNNVVTLEAKVQVVPFPFKKGQLSVDAKKMENEKEIGASQNKLNDELQKLVKLSPQKKLWVGSFYAPTEITRISTDFGTIRTTPEKGRYAHKGLDVVNIPRGIVWAPQDGVIVLIDRYAYSGNTIVIDHGWGIFSLFFHLDSFHSDLVVGQNIKKGNPVGRIGMTGYASGYHLHWEMRVNDVPVDPLEWTKPGF